LVVCLLGRWIDRLSDLWEINTNMCGERYEY